VYPGKLPVRAGCVIVRNILAVEYFGFVLPLQEYLHTAPDGPRSWFREDRACAGARRFECEHETPTPLTVSATFSSITGSVLSSPA
jgi:hypothetical protein